MVVNAEMDGLLLFFTLSVSGNNTHMLFQDQIFHPLHHKLGASVHHPWEQSEKRQATPLKTHQQKDSHFEN